MINKFKKSLAIFLLIVLVLVQNGSALVYASPEAPSAPSVPSAPSTNTPEAPSAPSAPSQGSNNDNDQDEDRDNNVRDDQDDNQQNSNDTAGTAPTPTGSQTSEQNAQSPSPATTQTNPTGVSQNGQTGDTRVETGDATNTGAASNIGNTNAAANANGTAGGGAAGSVGIVNSNNGQNSQNNGSVVVVNDNTTNQSNTADLNNTLNQSSNSGNNSVSGNNNGNATIKTGDANTSGTIVNAVNTNVEGLMISEFNIEEDQNGDFVLDFAANCISGCENAGSVYAKNSGNAQNSTNNADITTVNNNTTFQNNDAGIANNLILDANSGYNVGDGNNNGDTRIQTGDANIAANALTFANTNIAGNVVYGVVNIYGDLQGDILFPEELAAMLAEGCTTCGSGDTTVTNSGNGQGSTNNASVRDTTNNQVFQNNDAVIDNVLDVKATTGDNKTSGNNKGDNTIITGDVDVMAQVLNVANTNILGGNMWLVLVNEAGRWVGKIMGAPEGSNMAASTGTEFTVDEKGDVTASNTNNGQNSTNNTAITNETNNTTVQTNNANVTNNLQLNANTGKNSASGNNGGNNTIETGDVNVVANIVNFVNNNIAGNGKLFVTVVNVFGSWMGDFVAPGQKQEPKPALAQQAEEARGGASAGSSNNSNQPADSHQETNSSDANNDDEDSDAVTTTYTGTTYRATVRGGGTVGQAVGGNEGTAQVAGVSTGLDTSAGAFDVETAGKKKVKINLAMILFVLPLFAVWMMLRKMLPKRA